MNEDSSNSEAEEHERVDRRWSKRESGGKRRTREKERHRTPLGWTRLASTTSDVATAQQSPGSTIPLYALSLPSRDGRPSTPPSTSRCLPTPYPAPFPGPWIDPDVRPCIRTSVRKLAATAVMSLCISAISQDVYTSVCVLIVRNACQICDIEPTGSL